MVPGGAGWHRSRELEVPANVSLLRPPPYGPGQNPVKTLFSVLRHRHLPNREFVSADHVRETVRRAWDGLIRRKDGITRITAREWAVP